MVMGLIERGKRRGGTGLKRKRDGDIASRHLEIHFQARGSNSRDLVLGIKVEVEARGDRLVRGLLLLRRGPKVELWSTLTVRDGL